jgi:hypothetical protein
MRQIADCLGKVPVEFECKGIDDECKDDGGGETPQNPENIEKNRVFYQPEEVYGIKKIRKIFEAHPRPGGHPPEGRIIFKRYDNAVHRSVAEYQIIQERYNHHQPKMFIVLKCFVEFFGLDH